VGERLLTAQAEANNVAVEEWVRRVTPVQPVTLDELDGVAVKAGRLGAAFLSAADRTLLLAYITGRKKAKARSDYARGLACDQH
jgi:hypothetical protein